MSDEFNRLKAALADQYTVEKEIGAGGMATVYRARDVKHDRDVAIKVLRPELSAAVGASRFLQEIRVTAQLHHPHILPLYDSGEADALLYYVMPYVEGESLRHRLMRQGPLSVDEAIRIAQHVAAALETAHSRGIVHRDIKPENILLVAAEAVVADFGIARAMSVSGGTQLTQPGSAVGTPVYMSPEQATGEGEIDGRSDVYALGCVLYEMLTGEPPYAAPTIEGIMLKRLGDPVPSARRIREAVPKSLDRAVQRALAKLPGDRFGTAAEFATALSTPTGGGGAVRSTTRRGRLWLIASAVVVMTAGAATWWLAETGTESASGSATRIVVLPFSFRGNEDVGYLGDGMVDLLSTKLDGAGTWRSVDPRAVFALVSPDPSPSPDPARARDHAGQLSAGLYVLGSVVEVGGTLRLNASLYDRDGGPEPIAQASAEGAVAQVLGLVDELASQLLVVHGEAAATRLTQIAAVTTHSLPALKAYLRGTSSLRRGDFTAAGAAFEEAVEADTAFALAWYQLSIAADWLLRSDLALTAAEQAVRFVDRLSERDRLLLEALRTVRRGDVDQAERLYRAFLGTYPDDVEAWYHLGEALFHFGPRLGRSLTESQEAMERLLALEPDQSTAYIHLARIAAVQGRSAALDSIASQVANLRDVSRVLLELRMLQALMRDDEALQARVTADLRAAADVDLAEVSWSAASFLGNPGKARQIVALLTDGPRSMESRMLGHQWLAYLELAQGRWGRAQEQLDLVEQLDAATALEHRVAMSNTPHLSVAASEFQILHDRLLALDPSEVPASAAPGVFFSVHDGLHGALRTYLLGLLSARLGGASEAERYADELEALVLPRETGSLAEDLARGIRASVAFTSGRAAEGLAELEAVRWEMWYQLTTSSPFYALAYERFLRARLLQQVGRDQDALRWYGTFANTSVHDLVYLAPSFFHRGEIYERLGEPEQAVSHYSRFVELWASADPTLQMMVEDARERIARLTTEGATTP
jgi:tetratricopeptide (TPR) repeat protein/tRNA A-37 threonylcarbamoyl transferase component Bud32